MNRYELKKKLQVRKESVKTLTGAQLGRVRGGQQTDPGGGSNQCNPSDACYTDNDWTCFIHADTTAC